MGTLGIKIDDDIPIPPRKRGHLNGNAAAMRMLQVGQSFVYVPRIEGTSCASQQNSASHTSRTAFKDRQFICRTVEENGKRVVRVWRIA